MKELKKGWLLKSLSYKDNGNRKEDGKNYVTEVHRGGNNNENHLTKKERNRFGRRL